MSDGLIRSLYEGRLNTWSAARSPVLPIAWENVDYTPTTNSTYLRAFVLRGDTGSEDLAGSLRNRVGVMQVNIIMPTGSGAGASESIAAELEALFPNNLRLTSGTFSVQVITPARVRSGFVSDDNWIVPVDFEYRSDSV